MGKPPSRVRRFGWMIGGISGAIGWVCPGLAQTMTLDGTLGPARTLTGPVYLIQQRDGRAIGRHLFHSFGRFNLDAGEVARFHHAANIQNIFARVTGGSASTINGLIATNGGQANLFLLNPNGILFGPNARLQVGGSFVATTANHIRFPDGSEFSAVQPQAPPLLRVNLTPGLQYGPRQGNIAHAGNLAVNPGQSLTLLGNTVTSTGRLIAPRGRVELLGDRVILRDQAQIDVSAVGGGGTVLIGGDFQGKGTVPNAQSTFVGPNVTINANGISPPTPLPHHPLTPSPQSHGGRVIVWADDTTRFYGQVNARGGSQSGNGGFVEISGKNHLAFAGQVDVSAAAGTLGTVLFDPRDIIIVAGIGADDAQLADGTIAATDGGTGDFQIGAGAIVGNTILQASRNIIFGAPVNITTAGAGLTAQAGNNITVNSSIQTNGGAIRLSANDPAIGSASGTGSISINADIRSRGGNISFSALGNILVNNTLVATDTGAVGNSGNITVQANRLILQNEGRVSTDTFGSGNAGNLDIRANDIEMVAPPPTSFYSRVSGITAIAAQGTGNGGKITIRTQRLTALNGAKIHTSTFSSGNGGDIDIQATDIELIGGDIFGLTSAILSDAALGSSGDAGNISINTQRLILRDGGGISSGALGSGDANQISIKATDIQLIGVNSIPWALRGIRIASAITAQAFSQSSGNSGQVSIETQSLLVQDGAVVSTNSLRSNGANLTIRATDNIRILNQSTVSSESLGQGTGGNLLIETPNFTLDNGSVISTGTAGQTQSGSITIRNSDSVVVSRRSVVGALGFETGRGGEVSIITRDLTVRDNGSGIVSSSTGSGDAGNLTVLATNSVNVLDGGLLSTGTVGTGAGSNLLIEAQNLNLQNEGKIFTSSLSTQTNTAQGNSGDLTIRINGSTFLDNSIISTLARGRASGGKLSLTTNQLTLQNGANISSATLGQGQGGNIDIQANSLILGTNGLISSRSEGQGSAANIALNVTGTLQADRGEITATSFLAGGGNVNISARDILLRNSSLISSSVFDSTGGGGDISIRSRSFVALEDSDILANAEFGPGGNITINSPVFLAALFNSGQATAVGRNPGSFGQFRGNGRVDISADSRFGTSGTVTYPNLDLTRGLIALPVDLTDPTTQLDTRCQPGTRQATSSYIETGRGGLPLIKMYANIVTHDHKYTPRPTKR